MYHTTKDVWWRLLIGAAAAVVLLSSGSRAAEPADAGTVHTDAYGATIYALLTLPYSIFDPPPETAIEVVDAASMAKVNSFPLGQRFIRSLAVSPDEETLYVADGAAGVVVVNGSDGLVETTVPLVGVFDLALSPDGDDLYATVGQSIVQIDTETNTVADTKTTGSDFMFGIAVSPDGGAIAAVSPTGGADPAVYVAASGNLQGAQRIPITGVPDGCGTFPGDVTMTNTGRALLWNDGCDDLYQVDVPGQAQITADTIDVGTDQVGGGSTNKLLYSPTSARAYAPRFVDLAVMDPVAVSGSALGGFSGEPFSIGLTPNGKNLFVSVQHNPDASTLDQLDTVSGTFTRDVYTFSLANYYAWEMKIVGPAALTQGDVDCSGGVNAIDAMKVLRNTAALSVTQTEPCPEIGTLIPLFADVDCSGAVNAVDSLKVLRHNAALSVSQTEPCPNIDTAFP